MLRRSAATLTLAGLAVLATTSSAYAYWTVSGSGTGTATVTTFKPLVIDPVDIKNMVIGRPAPLKGEVRNPNNFEVSLTGLQLTVKVKADQAHRACVDRKNIRVVAPKITATLIKANDTTSFDGGTITIIAFGAAKTACQGATLTLDYALT
jgi:hypothetical protein